MSHPQFRRASRPLLLAVALLSLLPIAARAETLGEILAAAAVAADDLGAEMLAQEIVSWAGLDDAEAFVVAGYRDSGTNALPDRPSLWHFDRRSGVWSGGDLALITAAGADVGICAGSVLAVERVAGFLFVRTHLTPSAGCELILDAELRLVDALFGWVVAAFASGEVVYHHNQVHFASFRPLELSLYHPATGIHRALFPPPPPYGELRERLLTERQLALARAGIDWCNRNNHPCTPLPFDSRLQGPVALNDDTDALAFSVLYDRSLVAAAAEPLEALYVYHRVRGRLLPPYRELTRAEASEFAPAVSGGDLSALLGPAALQALFGDGR